MRVFLKKISGQLKQFSKSLDKKSILIDQPWALIDDEFEMQKLIFKTDGQLIMSKNGSASTGSWEYLAIANSLLIDRGEDKILCKEEFIDEGILILRLDGTSDKYFALANENIIPDLDIQKYLNSKIQPVVTHSIQSAKKINATNQNLKKFILNNGTPVYIDLKKNSLNYRKGDIVYQDPIGEHKLMDGYYKLSFIEGFRVSNGRII